MSAIAGIGGIFLWLVILSLPVLIYFAVGYYRAKRASVHRKLSDASAMTPSVGEKSDAEKSA